MMIPLSEERNFMKIENNIVNFSYIPSKPIQILEKRDF